MLSPGGAVESCSLVTEEEMRGKGFSDRLVATLLSSREIYSIYLKGVETVQWLVH